MSVLDTVLLYTDSYIPKEYIIDDKAISELKKIKEIKLKSYMYKNVLISIKELQYRTSNFMYDIFNIHDVGIINDERMYQALSFYKQIPNKDFVELFNSFGIDVNPFDIPIDFQFKDFYQSALIPNIKVIEDPYFKKAILPKLKMYFKNIRLSEIITNLTASSYVHEITHSQLQSHKGIVKEFYNHEVLPIFMELLYAYSCDENMYKYLLNFRIDNLYSCYDYLLNNYYMVSYPNFDHDFYNEQAKYFNSILKAFNLLNAYQFGYSDIKYDIISKIQKVFNGEISLETLLNNYYIDYNNSLDSNIIKNLVK